MATSANSFLIAAVLLSATLITGCEQPGNGGEGSNDQDSAGYVGSQTCAECHPAATSAWQSSHHALAMQPANEQTVLGDFADSGFTHNGITSRFFQRDGQYYVETDGPNGELAVFPVRYTFGVYPLQQYLLELDNKKIQALSVAWDSRPAEEGGQHWFHTYGDDELINFEDVLHWTQPSQNWETMCADCHSTALISNYLFDTDRFETHWAEINVACEACHGPAKEHLAWANDSEADRSPVGKGFDLVFDERKGASWSADPLTAKPVRAPALSPSKELNACGGCHSRRAKIADDSDPASDLLDVYLPSLIDEPLYYADGQIRDEVYVWGSFMQSKMHAAGVTCSDCHEPHSLRLRAPGAAVCLQCHESSRYQAIEHTLHDPEGESQHPDCIDCHMPATVYMQNDARNDHSFRIPRPQLTLEFGIPNACNGCHSDKTAEWARDTLQRSGKLPDDAVREHWTYKLAAGDPTTDSGRALLLKLATNPAYPDIIRASAVAKTGFPDNESTQKWLTELADSDNALIRMGVARSLRNSAPSLAAKIGAPLLRDPIRAVRLEAASSLVGIDTLLLPAGTDADMQAAVQEYLSVQELNSERAESHVNIGNVERALNRAELAQAAYRKAIRQNSSFIPAYVNLADLYREQNREAEAEVVLREALFRAPESSVVNHALGLSLVRQQKTDVALEYLRQAALSPDATPRYALVYALALDSLGQRQSAKSALQEAISRFGPLPELQRLASELESQTR